MPASGACCRWADVALSAEAYSHDEYEIDLGGGLYASYADEPELIPDDYYSTEPIAPGDPRGFGSLSIDRFTPRERWAFHEYINYGPVLNQWLRFGDSDPTYCDGEDPDNLARIAAVLYYAIKRCDPLPEDTVLYRGIDLGSYERMSAAGVGGLVTDTGFCSTTTDERVAQMFALYDFTLRYKDPHPGLDQLVVRILPLPGTRALPIDHLAGFAEGDQELLLAPGCRFRIEYDGRPILRMVETDDEPAIQAFGQRGQRRELLAGKALTDKIREAADYARCSHWWTKGATYNPACRH